MIVFITMISCKLTRCTQLSAMVFLFLLLFMTACSEQLSQSEAEDIALGFVKSNVKFYARNESDMDFVDAYTLEVTESYQQAEDWYVFVNVTSSMDEKGAKMVVVLDPINGNVKRFQKVE